VYLLIYGTQKVGYFGDSGRFEVWEKALSMYGWESLTGRGLGHFSDFFIRQFGLVHYNQFRHVHNEFLEVLFAFGLIGVACFSYLLLQVKKSTSLFCCCLVSILANCFFNFYFHISVLALIGIITYVILYIEQQGESHGF
jgi:O-antigen ligase